METILNQNSLCNIIVLITSLIHLPQMIENILPLIQIILQTFFSYQFYIIDNKELKTKIMKKIQNYWCCCYNENKEPLRFVFEKKIFPSYFLYITESSYDVRLHIFAKEETFNYFLEDDYTKKVIVLNDDHIPMNEKNKDDLCDSLLEKNSISFFSFSGCYGSFYINERQINLSNINTFQWHEYQTNLFCNIMNFYKQNNYCKVFLSGNPGQGKTFFSYLMAQKLNCYLTDEYNPCDPGNSLDSIYYRAKKISPNKPFIIVLDEVDILLSKIHDKTIIPHKNFKSEVHDKISWNQFLDKISYGLYPYIIMIIISNKTKKEIDLLDKAYLRKGRIDLYEEWS